MKRDAACDEDELDEDAEADPDDGGPAKPQKKFYRTRAHTNVLNANDFWFPARPEDVPLGDYFPGLGSAPLPIDFVDIGCGYGSLLTELAPLFPSAVMLGIEIRPKVVEYVQKPVAPPNFENIWATHNNCQRFMPNFFHKGQLSKLFFCFADPHFKRKNHRKRIVSHALLAEYAYVMRPGGRSYVITDVAELMLWIVEHFSATPLFERLTREQLRADPAVPALIRTDEGLKVQRNNGNMYIAVFEKRVDPLAPRAPAVPNDNALAAEAASDAGYTPQAGGELRGMTW